MDYISQYPDVDALPAIDKEFDNPIVKQSVQYLIDREMKIFAPRDYISEIPNLLSENELNEIVKRIEQSAVVTLKKLDPNHGSFLKPEAGRERDLQAWQQTLAHNKALLVHQENQILNLEIAEQHSAKPYLAYNAVLENVGNFYSDRNQELNRQIYDLQMARQSIQEKVYPQLMKFTKKRDESLFRRIHCDQTVEYVNTILKHRGFSYDDYLAKVQLENVEIDEHDGKHNSTVRAYETVQVMDVESDDDEAIGPTLKKSRTK